MRNFLETVVVTVVVWGVTVVLFTIAVFTIVTTVAIIVGGVS